MKRHGLIGLLGGLVIGVVVFAQAQSTWAQSANSIIQRIERSHEANQNRSAVSQSAVSQRQSLKTVRDVVRGITHPSTVNVHSSQKFESPRGRFTETSRFSHADQVIHRISNAKEASGKREEMHLKLEGSQINVIDTYQEARKVFEQKQAGKQEFEKIQKKITKAMDHKMVESMNLNKGFIVKSSDQKETLEKGRTIEKQMENRMEKLTQNNDSKRQQDKAVSRVFLSDQELTKGLSNKHALIDKQNSKSKNNNKGATVSANKTVKAKNDPVKVNDNKQDDDKKENDKKKK